MSSKAKLVSLQKYLDDLKNRASAPTPAKHKDGPDTYLAFLKNEMRITSAAIEAMKLDGVK